MNIARKIRRNQLGGHHICPEFDLIRALMLNFHAEYLVLLRLKTSDRLDHLLSYSHIFAY